MRLEERGNGENMRDKVAVEEKCLDGLERLWEEKLKSRNMT